MCGLLSMSLLGRFPWDVWEQDRREESTGLFQECRLWDRCAAPWSLDLQGVFEGDFPEPCILIEVLEQDAIVGKLGSAPIIAGRDLRLVSRPKDLDGERVGRKVVLVSDGIALIPVQPIPSVRAFGEHCAVVVCLASHAGVDDARAYGR